MKIIAATFLLMTLMTCVLKVTDIIGLQNSVPTSVVPKGTEHSSIPAVALFTKFGDNNCLRPRALSVSSQMLLLRKPHLEMSEDSSCRKRCILRNSACFLLFF
jgi:hypothetical protein